MMLEPLDLRSTLLPLLYYHQGEALRKDAPMCVEATNEDAMLVSHCPLELAQ